MVYPYYQEILYQNPFVIFHHVAAQTGTVFLDSSRLMEGCGRYSYIAVDPFQWIKSKNEWVEVGQDILCDNPFDVVERELKKFPLLFHPDLPAFQGGAVGYFSYDLCHHVEKLPRTLDDMHFPDLVLGLYDLVIAFDHLMKRAWIFSSGYPFLESSLREERAKNRCAWLQNTILNLPSIPVFTNWMCDKNHIQSNFSKEKYEDAVKKVKEYILEGEIFEANISQRFKTEIPPHFSSVELYRRLRCINPAPFSSYLNFDNTVIASASPERFLKLSNGQVEARPIKGTRPRGKNVEEDKQLASELLTSEKDRSENIMIVDLLRNDLSRVCENHSVKVPQLCQLESYATVHHLVSVVKGKIKKNLTGIDLLRAAFPGGSITGAPKIRSMEIISEIEPTQRGPYCGSVAYLGFNGDLDSSITIRTYAIKNNSVTFQAGGAVVADSDPTGEYVETLAKVNALIKALTEIPEYDDTFN